ncbi:hypothetical protein HELRODRAFT_174328 [Helobdella robusta]|uniref:Uncharacterized protein n=1 Tax=Helobdella robusta TaxID=6412 RepID=T1F807_HELRO|nr:hypothetical protein HELRODRAFT_174328 [Helobdella robusta]ESO02886.1 hypothetical protein HELRODRAFT_174328 [Helobdella robusta]
MKKMNLSILSLSETRWKKSGVITFEEGKFIYSDGDSHKRKKNGLTESAREVLLMKEQGRSQKWIIDDIVFLMDDRRKVKGCNLDSYKKLDKTIKKMFLETKEKWLNDKCKIIEKIKNSNTSAMDKISKKSLKKGHVPFLDA